MITGWENPQFNSIFTVLGVWTAVQVKVSVEAQNNLQPQYVAAPCVWMKVCCLVLRPEFLQSRQNYGGLFTGPFINESCALLVLKLTKKILPAVHCAVSGSHFQNIWQFLKFSELIVLMFLKLKICSNQPVTEIEW